MKTLLICLTITIYLNFNSAIRYKNRKSYDGVNDKYKAENKGNENSENKKLTQRIHWDPEDAERKMQVQYELAYQKFRERTAPKKEYIESETMSQEYSSAEQNYEHEKINLETRRANGLEPKGFWSQENVKKTKKNKEAQNKFVNNTKKTILLDKNKLDQKPLERIDGHLKNIQKRHKKRFRKKKLSVDKESVEKYIDKDNKKYIDMSVDIDQRKINESNMTNYRDLIMTKENSYENMKQEMQVETDRKHYRRKFSSKELDSPYRREESIERRDSQERIQFETNEFQGFESKRMKTKHAARSLEFLRDAIHSRKNGYYYKGRHDIGMKTHTHKGEIYGAEDTKDTKKQFGNFKEIEHKTKQEDGKTKGRHRYRKKLPKKVSIEYTDMHRLSEENEKYVPEENNESKDKPKSRNIDKHNKVESNQHDTEYHKKDTEDEPQINRAKEHVRHQKYSNVINRRLGNQDHHSPEYKRLPNEAKPRRIKSFSVERFERVQKQTQDQYFEQEISDYHDPDVLPPQVPHRKLKPIQKPSKKISRANEPPHHKIKLVEDGVELSKGSKPVESEERGEVFKKPVVPIETTTFTEFYRPDSELNYVPKRSEIRPNEELENIEKVVNNNEMVEHVTKSRYEQYLQHFLDNHDNNKRNQIKNYYYESNTKSNVNEYENDPEKAKNKFYDRNNYYKNKKEYEHENNYLKNNNENYNHHDNSDKNVDKKYIMKEYVHKNDKFVTVSNNDNFEKGQTYRNNENHKINNNKNIYENNENTEKSHSKINKNELNNIEHIKSSDYYENNINNAPNHSYDNRNYINRDNINIGTNFKDNYDNKNDGNNNYKNNDYNANNNNYEQNRNNNPRVHLSNYRDKPETFDERRPIQGYESRLPYEKQLEDRYNPPTKLVTLNYQTEIENARDVQRDHDRQPTIDANYGNYPESYQSATPSINNGSPQRPFLGRHENTPQESHLDPPQSNTDEKDSLINGPKMRIEEKPTYRIHYLDFRRRYRKKHNLSETKSKLSTQRSSEFNVMINDDSNHTKNTVSKDLIKQWRRGYSNIENEQKPEELKIKRKNSKKIDLNIIGPREIAFLREKYTIPRAEQSGSTIFIDTVETSKQGNVHANSSVIIDNATAPKNDENRIIGQHLTRRKNKNRKKKHKSKKDDFLNLTDAIIDNKVTENHVQNQSKVSIETTMGDDLVEMDEMEEKNYTENFKSNVWSALKKSIFNHRNENKTDNIMFLKMASTAHNPQVQLNVADIKPVRHQYNYDSDTNISDSADKVANLTPITERYNNLWGDKYENPNIQMLQYPADTRKHRHDKHYEDNQNLKEEFVPNHKIPNDKVREHGRHTDNRNSDIHIGKYSKNHYNGSISKYDLYKNIDNDNLYENYNDHNKRKHVRLKNKYNDEEDDTEIVNDNNVNERQHNHHKIDDHVVVDHYIRSKDRIDLVNKDISHENSKSKPRPKHTPHKNYDNDHKTKSKDETHDNASTYQKINDKKSVKHEFLVKHDKKATDENVEYVKIMNNNKYTTAYSKSEHAKTEYAKTERDRDEHSELKNKIQNIDTGDNTENTKNQNEHLVFTNLKNYTETDKKIEKQQTSSTGNKKNEHTIDLPKVQAISILARNKSETAILRSVHVTSSQESNVKRTKFDDDCKTEDGVSDPKFPFIVMLLQELDQEFKSICTAVTITPNFALTAAHCIPTDPKPNLHINYENHTKIHKNKNNYNKTERNNDDSGLLPYIRNSTKVLKIFEHPNYRQVFIKKDTDMEGMYSSTVNDIAVLKTEYNLPEPAGKLSAFEFNSLLGVSVNFYGMENNNCTKGALADVTLRQDGKKYILQTHTGAVATCNVKAKGITLCLATECNRQFGEKLNMLEGGPVIFSDRVVGIVNEIEPAITFVPVSPYLDWITQILDQEKPRKTAIERVFVKII